MVIFKHELAIAYGEKILKPRSHEFQSIRATGLDVEGIIFKGCGNNGDISAAN